MASKTVVLDATHAWTPATLTFVPMVASAESWPPPDHDAREARWVLETAHGVRVTMSGASSLVVDGLVAALARLDEHR